MQERRAGTSEHRTPNLPIVSSVRYHANRCCNTLNYFPKLFKKNKSNKRNRVDLKILFKEIMETLSERTIMGNHDKLPLTMVVKQC